MLRRTAFSLVELLVVIALIAVLVGLTLAAVQRVRSTVARSQCQNQLRQIGLALHHYHTTHDHFPAGVTGDRPEVREPYLSWCARLLPYLEQQALWQQIEKAFQQERNFLYDPPHTALKTPVKHLACPSDRRTATAQPAGREQVLRAFTSYLGVVGYSAAYNDGLLFMDSKIRFADVTDGTSHTLLVGERPPSADFAFGWWYAGWGQDKDGEGDMLLGVRTKNRSPYGRGCPGGPYDYKAGRIDNQCDAFHFWSPHINGANFLYADGSVRLLSYSANDLLPALASRAGGDVVELP